MSKIPTIEANIRRLRTIYRGLTALGAIGCLLVFGQAGSDGSISGPLLGALAFSAGVLLLGASLWWLKGRVNASPIVRLLRDHPERITHVVPRVTEGQVGGSTVARYQWIVLVTESGDQHDIYVAGNARAVTDEVVSCAPEAQVDPRLLAGPSD